MIVEERVIKRYLEDVIPNLSVQGKSNTDIWGLRQAGENDISKITDPIDGKCLFP